MGKHTPKQSSCLTEALTIVILVALIVFAAVIAVPVIGFLPKLVSMF